MKRYTMLCPKLLLLYCICICVLTTHLYAASISPIDDTLITSTSELQNIQKQVLNLAQNIYVNKVNGKDNASNKRALNSYKKKTDTLRTTLRAIQATETLTKTQKAKVSTLVAAASYIFYMITNLEEYSDATDALSQFELLSTHFQVDALLNQIFSYVD